MRFKIVSKKNDGSTVIHFYDNQTHDIETANGIPIILADDPRCKNLIKKIIPRDFESMQHKDSNKITSLRIVLGLNCNFHCKYCYEHTVLTPKQGIHIHEDLDTRAENLVNRVFNALPNLTDITFWGGEPLVYFKIMKKLITLFRKKYPKIVFSSITNGALLTVDIAKYLIENKIRMTVSHDGPSFNVYRDDQDPLDNEKSLAGIKYLFEHDPNTTFNMVITPENADLQKIIPFFESKLGFVPKIHFESIVKLTEETKGIITPFDEQTSKVLLNNLVAFGSTPDESHAYGCVRQDVSAIIRRLVNKSHNTDVACMICGEYFLAIDIQGNLLSCHGNGFKYGTLETINTSRMVGVHSWKERKQCKDCPFLIICRGACAVQNDKNNEIVCNNMKLYYAGHFIAAWKILFNSTITRIEPIGE